MTILLVLLLLLSTNLFISVLNGFVIRFNNAVIFNRKVSNATILLKA